MHSTYHFGQLVNVIDLFSFPRTGVHYLNYCLVGLFDVVAFNHPYLHHEEAVTRQHELNPYALYALTLREAGADFRPVQFRALASDVHGKPTPSESPAIILIRDPIATAFSLYRVQRDRWGGLEGLSKEWLQETLVQYTRFYDHALQRLAIQPTTSLIVRWEDLVRSYDELERIVAFVNITPKLTPSFVWQTTAFENFVRPGERTFYRSGKNTSWHNDTRWVRCLSELQDMSFEHLGYKSIREYTQDAEDISANRHWRR